MNASGEVRGFAAREFPRSPAHESRQLRRLLSSPSLPRADNSERDGEKKNGLCEHQAVLQHMPGENWLFSGDKRLLAHD